MGGISNRMKEIKRRRHRRQKVSHFRSKLAKAMPSEKQVRHPDRGDGVGVEVAFVSRR